MLTCLSVYLSSFQFFVLPFKLFLIQKSLKFYFIMNGVSSCISLRTLIIKFCFAFSIDSVSLGINSSICIVWYCLPQHQFLKDIQLIWVVESSLFRLQRYLVSDVCDHTATSQWMGKIFHWVVNMYNYFGGSVPLLDIDNIGELPWLLKHPHCLVLNHTEKEK